MIRGFLVPIIVLLSLTIGFMVFSDDLAQDNREDLFLSLDFEKELVSDRELNPLYDTIVVYTNVTDNSKLTQLNDALSKLELDYDELEWLSPWKLVQTNDLELLRSQFKKSTVLKFVDEGGLFLFFHLDSEDIKERMQFVTDLELVAETNNLNFKFAGMPYLNYRLGLMSLEIKKVVMPILFVSVAVLLFFLLANWQMTLVTFIPSLFGVSFSLALLKVIFGHSTMVTTLVPILVFLVLLSLTLHLALAACSLKSLSLAWKEKRYAVTLALMTTLLGLLSLLFSDIPAIRQFSLASSIALSVSSLVALGFWHTLKDIRFDAPKRVVSFVSHLDFSFPKLLSVMALTLILLTGLWSWKNLGFQVEALYFFPEHQSFVNDWREVEAKLGGMPLLDLHKDLPEKSMAVYQSQLDFEENLLAQISPMAILSPHQIVLEANQQYSGKRELPQALVAYETLLSRLPRYFRPSVTDEQYTLTLLGKTLSTQEYLTWLDSLSLPDNLRLGGLYYWMMKSQDGLIQSMTKSFLSGLVFVTFALFLLMRSWKDAMLFFFINIVPAFGTLSVFMLLGKELNVASITTFSISFGLIVDSTLHLMIHYKRHGLKHDHFLYESIFAPMFLVTVVMVIGFLGLCFFPFAPVADFGLSMGLTLFFGFVLDFYILPSLEKAKLP